MPQNFHVLQCYSCNTFQVHIVKKVLKWCCKMCGEKQSVKMVYGRGSGKDCRLLVQELNEKRINLEAEVCDQNTFKHHPESAKEEGGIDINSKNSKWLPFIKNTDIDEDHVYVMEQKSHSFANESKWDQFIPENVQEPRKTMNLEEKICIDANNESGTSPLIRNIGIDKENMCSVDDSSKNESKWNQFENSLNKRKNVKTKYHTEYSDTSGNELLKNDQCVLKRGKCIEKNEGIELNYKKFKYNPDNDTSKGVNIQVKNVFDSCSHYNIDSLLEI